MTEDDCECEFDTGDCWTDRDFEPWHYRLVCEHCGYQWCGLHCPHDGIQNPCPGCGVLPGEGTRTPLETLKDNWLAKMAIGPVYAKGQP